MTGFNMVANKNEFILVTMWKPDADLHYQFEKKYTISKVNRATAFLFPSHNEIQLANIAVIKELSKIYETAYRGEIQEIINR